MNQAEPPSSGARIAFVQACWHRAIVESGRDGFLRELERLGVPPDRVDVFEVPGSLAIDAGIRSHPLGFDLSLELTNASPRDWKQVHEPIFGMS